MARAAAWPRRAALVAAPLAARARLALRNTGLKLRQRSSCCGNPGEPGC